MHLPFFVSCERGTEGALRRELVGLSIHAPKGAHGGVTFEGPFEDAMRICLHARTAMRVLMRIAAGPAENAEALYALAHAVDWTAHLDARHTFAVRAAAFDSATLVHSGFVALKVKDAIADRLRDTVGARPDVDAKDPDVTVVVHVHGNEARIFLDLAGEPLHRRGYRVAMTDAPLKETLAAAMLALGDVAPDAPLIDPMCGSGTIAIEQALAARRIPPGARRRFGFERWPSEDRRAAWPAIREAALAAILPTAPAPIFARDVSETAIAAARKNAAAAGVQGDIRFDAADASALTPPDGSGPGTIVFNPPYGERLPRAQDRRPSPQHGESHGRRQRARGAGGSPRRLARTLSLFWGWRVLVLSPDTALAEALGIDPDFTHRLKNGGLNVLLQRYSLGGAARPDG